MKVPSLVSLASLAAIARAATNEPCVGEGGIAGVCAATSTCSDNGGTSIAGACPGDAADVQCCTKPQCDNGGSGNCRWQSDCDSEAVAGQCPGPSQMMCCSSDAEGFGGYSPPTVPEVSDSCQAVSVEGANSILEEFPGRVREVFCTRDCEDGNTSDHCTGKAMDMMCADGGGVSTSSGRSIAEWVMENHEALNVKYIIWGQRIWNPSQDEAAEWTSWRGMEDRGDITQNHWHAGPDIPLSFSQRSDLCVWTVLTRHGK